MHGKNADELGSAPLRARRTRAVHVQPRPPARQCQTPERPTGMRREPQRAHRVLRARPPRAHRHLVDQADDIPQRHPRALAAPPAPADEHHTPRIRDDQPVAGAAARAPQRTLDVHGARSPRRAHIYRALRTQQPQRWRGGGQPGHGNRTFIRDRIPEPCSPIADSTAAHRSRFPSKRWSSPSPRSTASTWPF